MSDDIIRRALGMDVQSVQENALVKIEDTTQEVDDNVEIDFDYVRDNLQELISHGKEAIEELLLIAKQSQHPRAFEVVATLLKATADINSDLLGLHKKKNELKPQQASHSKGVNTVNQLFVGSTAELQAFLENQKKKNE